MPGRDPRDAPMFTQRICGVCTTVHALASCRAVENALKLEVPVNAQYIRNLILAAHALHDHIVHFYILSAVDWVDIPSALKADPKKAAAIADGLSSWPLNNYRELAAVQEKLKTLVNSRQLGIFANGYWGHPAMKLPPEVNLLAVSHYLQALEYQRKANMIVSILGSKTPHIQNMVVGGVSSPINMEHSSALNMERLYYIKSVIDEVGAFVKQVYVPDVCAVGAMYAGWTQYGAGVTNYLSVPDMPMDRQGKVFSLPGGYIENGDLKSFKPITDFNSELFRYGVKESVRHSWYKSDWTRHPYDETTEPNYTDFQEKEKYSWVKSPSFNDKPAQVGPLANVLCMYAAGHGPTKQYVKTVLDTVSSIAGTQVGPQALHSTIGRHAARAVRAAVLYDELNTQWQALMDNIAKGDLTTFTPFTFPAGEIRGFGFHEAPRGTLSHWTVIDSGKIKNYQAVVPTTWNAGPRNQNDALGPYEAALIGNPVADPERPLEVVRTIHSFDPCLACAIHMVDAKGRPIVKVKTL
jgi:hydrogenase large subunit